MSCRDLPQGLKGKPRPGPASVVQRGPRALKGELGPGRLSSPAHPAGQGRSNPRPQQAPLRVSKSARGMGLHYQVLGHHHQAEGQADLLPSPWASIQNRQGRARQKSDRPLPSQAAASSGKSVDSGLKLKQRLEPSQAAHREHRPSALRGVSGAHADKRPQDDNILGIVTSIVHFIHVSLLGPHGSATQATVISVLQRMKLGTERLSQFPRNTRI